jgi:sugar phosphate isomerase/epimerase
VIDWPRVIAILQAANWSGVLSVECGTSQQAVDSLAHLNAVLSKTAQAVHA